MQIKTQAEFEDWLESNFRLDHFIIRTLEPYPKIASENVSGVPSKIKIIGTLDVGRIYEAGKKTWMRDIEIIAHGVTDYSISLEDGFSPGHWCSEIELINVEQG